MDIFTIREYSHTRHKNFVERDCVICNRNFKLPKSIENSVSTCCKYCQILALSWKKNKGRYVLCKMCDKPIWEMPSKSKVYCSKDCHNLAMSVCPNENNLGLIQTGRKKYYGANWLSQRRKARKRDKYTCQKCGITEEEYEQELSVHHLKPFVYFETYKEANKLDNLTSLCEPCHRIAHSGENHTTKFEKEKIVFKNQLNTTVMKQKEKAQEVLNLLLNTNKTLREISQITGISYSKVQKMYRGDSWKSLYEKPPRETNPRAKGEGLAILVYKMLLETDLTLTEIAKRTGVSLAMVQDLYKGRTYKGLYDTPIYKVKPRKRADLIFE